MKKIILSTVAASAVDAANTTTGCYIQGYCGLQNSGNCGNFGCGAWDIGGSYASNQCNGDFTYSDFRREVVTETRTIPSDRYCDFRPSANPNSNVTSKSPDSVWATSNNIITPIQWMQGAQSDGQAYWGRVNLTVSGASSGLHILSYRNGAGINGNTPQFMPGKDVYTMVDTSKETYWRMRVYNGADSQGTFTLTATPWHYGWNQYYYGFWVKFADVGTAWEGLTADVTDMFDNLGSTLESNSGELTALIT